MTVEEKLSYMKTMLGSECEDDEETLSVYLNMAHQKLLDHMFPFNDKVVEIDSRYDMDMVELAVVLYNRRGGEGEKRHIENGVHREYRTEQEILSHIPREAGLPL